MAVSNLVGCTNRQVGGLLAPKNSADVETHLALPVPKMGEVVVATELPLRAKLVFIDY
jgi:hypothetical protein